jgi:BCD family chlorophyll transporter-like MFS transporter
MVSLPIIFAPFRALIGFRSDVHQSQLGWKRVPFIWKGTLIQFGGLAIMPFALLVLSGGAEAAHAPVWIGRLGAGVAFLLVGAGLHMTQTVGLALATDLVPPESQPKVVGLMYVMLLAGMIASSLIFGAMLVDFTPGRLIQVIQGAAVATMALNVVALWKQEPRRSREERASPKRGPTFRESWSTFAEGEGATRRLLALGLGTMAFSMADILLEPYGGQILSMSVSETTKLTATLAVGTLIGFWVASLVLGRGADAFGMARIGSFIGIPGFVCVIVAAPLASSFLFALGTLALGVGTGLFGHGTLTATMNTASEEQRGLALGAWGAVQATAAGIAVAMSGVIRDAVSGAAGSDEVVAGISGAAVGYMAVYGLEIVLLVFTIATMASLIRSRPASGASLFVTPVVVNQTR